MNKTVLILGGDFRSIAANKLYKFNNSFRTDRLSTKIFAGLNGSGKSNFLELFSEIFYFLEIYHLSTVSTVEKKNKNFGFEIEYLLQKGNLNFSSILGDQLYEIKEKYIANNYRLSHLKRHIFENLYNEEIENEVEGELNALRDKLIQEGHVHVKVTKRLEDEPEFSLKNYNEIDSFHTVSVNTSQLLPRKVIAYTSGQNEILSNPYYKLKYHYFKEFSEEKGMGMSEAHRLFFLDYNTNFSIFIANMLLADETKLGYLKQILNVNKLQSFRITLNLVDIYKKTIPFSESLASNLSKLKLCATSWIEKKVNKEHLLVLDYLVTDATKSAFEYHFTNAFNLFKAFYDLEILNLFLVRKDTRNLMLRVHKNYNFSDELPKPDPSRLVFRIEKIWVNKLIDSVANRSKNVYYKALSDGEHQFNEVIGTILMMEEEGCLFLMDEPDTHFNPMWRAKMIKLLNYVAATKFEEREKLKLDLNGKILLDENKQPIKENYLFPVQVRNQEVILTTHSPFIISDSQTEDVYKFEKVDNQVDYDNPKSIETYGASIGLLLKEIFDREISISDLSNYDIEILRNAFLKLDSKQEIQQKIEETKAKLVDFGESIEKFDLYSFLREIEKEIENK